MKTIKIEVFVVIPSRISFSFFFFFFLKIVASDLWNVYMSLSCFVGDCYIVEKPWKVPAENVGPSCSIGSCWWSSCILNVSMRSLVLSFCVIKAVQMRLNNIK